MQINFETTSNEETKNFKKELKDTIYQRFDQLIVYADSEKFEDYNNLNGKIVFSDDGLFYHTREQVIGNNNDISFDELESIVNSLTIDEKHEIMNMQEPKEAGITVDQLKNTLISLKNEKVKEIGDGQNIWIYIEAESHVSIEDIIDVLTLLKFLKISHKSYQGKY